LLACVSGRARPEVEQQIPWIVGVPASPAAYVTGWGDTVVIDRSADDFQDEYSSVPVIVIAFPRPR